MSTPGIDDDDWFLTDREDECNEEYSTSAYLVSTHTLSNYFDNENSSSAANERPIIPVIWFTEVLRGGSYNLFDVVVNSETAVVESTVTGISLGIQALNTLDILLAQEKKERHFKYLRVCIF